MSLIQLDFGDTPSTDTNALGTDVVAVDAAHQAGELYPTFTLTFRPHRPDPNAPAAHLTSVVPSPITITANGLTWVCIAQDAPRSLQGRSVTCQVTYIPKAAYVLRNRKYNKTILFVSAPQWQFQQLETILQPEKHVIKYKESDVYTATGWTVNEVIAEISKIFEASENNDDHVTIVSDLPDLHIPQPTLTYTPDQTFLSFIQSLLPGNFSYLWDWQNGELHLCLAEPATTTLTVPPRAITLDYAAPPVMTYDSVIVSGGQYKRTQAIDLGKTNYFGAHASNDTANKIITETSTTTDSSGRTMTVTRKIQQTPEATPFAILEETVELRSGSTLLQRIVTANTYEQTDANIYEVPRFLSSTTTTSGTIWKYLSGERGGSDWFLTSSGVLSGGELGALSGEDKPDVYVSAYREWQTNFEQRSEQKTYTAQEDVTKDWAEGSERTNEVSITRYMVCCAGIWFDSTLDGRQTLIQLPLASMAVTMQMKMVERIARTVRLQTKKQYVFEEIRSVAGATGELQEQPVSITRIESYPPAAPTRYRTETLKAIAGTEPDDSDHGELCYSTTSTIPTNNPHDFARWATKLYYDMTHPQQAMTVTTKDYVMPVGYRLSGGTVTSWHVSQQGAASSATMTLI